MKRDIGQEILEGVRELKQGRTGRVTTLPPIANRNPKALLDVA